MESGRDGPGRDSLESGLENGIDPSKINLMTSLRASSLILILAALWILAGGAPARAQAIERLGDFEAWSAFRFKESGKTACYMASQPKTAKGNYKKRGEIYGLVTHRPAEKRRDEVSFVAGYSYKTDSFVEVEIGGRTWQLFTQKAGAWAVSEDDDMALVQSMIKGSTMVVKGTSTRGTLTTDTYSLKGFSKAHKAIDAACAP